VRNRKLLVTCLASAFSAQASAANIVIDPGVGFDDPTPSVLSQKGNNPGATLGAMRLIVFEKAANIWGATLNSNVTITVHADFIDSLGCTGNSAMLGFAGPTSAVANFAGGEANVVYPIALAESLSGTNLNNDAPEINASFNEKIDSDSNCLGGGGFYYGLDNNAPAGTYPIFATILHEMGHGLGFLSLVGSDGSLFGNMVGTFSRQLRDVEIDKSWADMNNPERRASQLNEPNLVWAGPKATADIDQHLRPSPEMRINAPGSGVFDVVAGEQTADIPNGSLTAPVVNGNSLTAIDSAPANGCSQISFDASLLNGKIVLFDATNACPPIIQAVFSQFAGAAGVIIASTSGTGLPDLRGLIGNEVLIPYVGAQRSAAVQLRANIVSANVTLSNSTTKFAGVNEGHIKMYAPAELEQGSSVSHWSRTASPNLLMEPVLGSLDFESVDLTAAAFSDIGWSVNIPGAGLNVSEQASDVIFESQFD